MIKTCYKYTNLGEIQHYIGSEFQIKCSEMGGFSRNKTTLKTKYFRYLDKKRKRPYRFCTDVCRLRKCLMKNQRQNSIIFYAPKSSDTFAQLITLKKAAT